MEAYSGTSPFSLYLKEQFARDRRMGSSDRRMVRHYCYCYFRTGRALSSMSTEEKLITGIWLCAVAADPLLEAVQPGLNKTVSLSLDEKSKMLGEQFSWAELFPFGDQLSPELDPVEWATSLLTQPELFIRIRPGHEQKIIERLKELQVSHTLHSLECVSFPATTNLDSIGEINSDYVVQDYSSQRVRELLEIIRSAKLISIDKPFRVWDCCAASGGKSILAVDVLGKIPLTVSDIRVSMLTQLKKRLAEADITHYHSMQVNLEKEIPSSMIGATDLLIADVPCSGSGTWGRTPEQNCFFNKEQITLYAARQRSILNHALRSISKEGYLLYITCSVFNEENEEQIAWLIREKGMQLIRSSLLKGMEKRADTLYAALLQRL